jgi:uncharacterized protein
MSVELGHLNAILRDFLGHASLSDDPITVLAERALAMSHAIATGIKENAIFNHPLFGQVYAYEVDGYGGRIFMDDANVPSLLSLPLLGFVDRKDPIYTSTRQMVLSSLGNPYFLQGPLFKGIGGPHIGVRHAWPMSLLVRIMTSDDDNEILESLDLLKRSKAGVGLMHESGIIQNLARLMISECKEIIGLYSALVCMGKWFIRGDDIRLDGKKTGLGTGERV